MSPLSAASSSVGRLALRSVLALFALITAWGFYEAKLFNQAVWLQAGLHRFLLFAAIYAGVFIIISLWKPAWFLPLVNASVLIYSLIAVGPVAILSVVLFLLASAVLGESILARRTRAPHDSAVDGVLGMLLGISIYMFAVSLAVHLPINYPGVYLAALLVPIVWNWQRTIHWARQVGRIFKPARVGSWSAQAALGALVFVLLSHWFLTLEPEISPDALAMHLGIPESVAAFHRFAFDVKNVVWAVTPMGGDWCFTVVNMLGGEAAARLLNLSFLLAMIALIIAAARRWLSSGPAFLIAALFAATPVTQLVTCSLFVENVWAALAVGAFAALFRFREERSPRLFYAAFVMLGAAAAAKYGALAFLVPVLLIALFVLWRQPRMTRLLCGGLLAFVVFAAPPYVTAYAKTGNPIFPYGSTSRGAPVHFPLTLRTPYDLTFHTSRLPEVQDGSAGFQYLLFLPLAFFRRRSEPRALASGALATCVLFSITTIATQPHLRYLYPAFPLATIAIASAFAKLRNCDLPLYRVSLALAIAVLALNLCFLQSADWFHKDYYTPVLSAEARSLYLTDHAPVRNVIEYLNRRHPGAPVAMFGTNSTAGLRAAAVTDSWHTPAFNAQLSSSQTPVDLRRLIDSYGIKYLVAPAPENGNFLRSTVAESFFQRCAAPEFRSGNYFLASVSPDAACAWKSGPPPTPAPAGQYDDRDVRIVFEGAWGRSRFAEASSGTLTESKTAGASFRFVFVGSEVTYVYTKALNRGVAEIEIDGVRQADLDLYSAAAQWQARTRFQCNHPGVHTLAVRVTGSRNPASSDTFVDADQFVVR